MRAVIFDLDNTLYPEASYVESGFRAVGEFLRDRFGVDMETSMSIMAGIMEKERRGKVFDVLLGRLHMEEVDPWLLIWLYRAHEPRIELFPEALAALEAARVAGCKVGVLTDGLSSVQCRKLQALGLAGHVDVAMMTGELGLDCEKPSTKGFELLLAALDVDPHEAAYIGDDPGKDFIAPNTLGMSSIMVRRPLRWPFGGEAPDSQYEAKHSVEDLMQAVSLAVESA